MNHRETMLEMSRTVNLTDDQKLAVARTALIAVHSSGSFSAAGRKTDFDDVTIAGSAWDLLVAALNATASGTEARQRPDPAEGLDPKGDGPTLEERDAQTPVPSSKERK